MPLIARMPVRGVVLGRATNLGPVFRRKKESVPSRVQGAPADVFMSLRSGLLRLDPASVGLADATLWGSVMETGYANGVATLVCLADGTTSLYTSTGGGIIGAGAHEQVVRANVALLALLNDHLAEMPTGMDEALPREGRTIIRALTSHGPRQLEAAEDDLGNGRSTMSPVFHAAHAVITELRKIDEARS